MGGFQALKNSLEDMRILFFSSHGDSFFALAKSSTMKP